MKINSVKISLLPLIKTLRGFFTVGVGPDGVSYKADLGFIEDAADNASDAASRAETATANAKAATTDAIAATDSANTATSQADLAASAATDAAASANTAAGSANQAAGNANTATAQANTARDGANTAATNANTARDNANSAASSANQAATGANTARDNANTAAGNATNAAGSANTAATNADTAKDSANSAAQSANTAAENADRAAEAIPALVAGKQDKLIPGTGITIGADGKTISAASRIVLISDFETFNPSASLVDSETGATFTLKEGESCQFKAAYNAYGKPWMSNLTVDQVTSSDALYSIYYWSGTITRIYGTYYLVTAYGANTTTGRPQVATRIYYSSSRYNWVVGSDFSSRSTSGYVKLPSGIMIQWGRGNGGGTLTFPLSFTTVYQIVFGTIGTPETLVLYHGVNVLSNSSCSLYSKWVDYNSVGNTNIACLWIAIGTWK